MSLRGKYSVRLWDVLTKRWTVMTVEGTFPCDRKTGSPIFARPCEGEFWVLLLEKAIAKYCGGYDRLQGGLSLWALHLMTGDYCFCLSRDVKRPKWSRLDLVLQGTSESPRRCGLRSTGEEYTHEELWMLLLAYDRGDAVIGASILSASGEAKRSDGLVAGHAYAVLQCRELYGIRLMQLRNPWGRFEWTGDWSDASPLSDTHLEVQAALWRERSAHRQGGSDEGSFWMSFKDFYSLFDQLDVCDRSVGVRDLALRFYEDENCLRGPTCACIAGCARFWCVGQGCRALYLGHQSSKKTRALPQRRCRCLECMNGGEPVLL